VFQRCQARGVQQEFQCLTRVFQSIERESVSPECATRVSGKSVSQECPIKVSHKSVPQECPTRVPHKSATRVSQKSVLHDCPRRVSSVKRECSARVAFNAIEHLLFAFHCSVGTLLLLELVKNAFGFVASISFFLGVCVLMEYNWKLSPYADIKTEWNSGCWSMLKPSNPNCQYHMLKLYINAIKFTMLDLWSEIMNGTINKCMYTHISIMFKSNIYLLLWQAWPIWRREEPLSNLSIALVCFNHNSGQMFIIYQPEKRPFGDDSPY